VHNPVHLVLGVFHLWIALALTAVPLAGGFSQPILVVQRMKCCSNKGIEHLGTVGHLLTDD